LHLGEIFSKHPPPHKRPECNLLGDFFSTFSKKTLKKHFPRFCGHSEPAHHHEGWMASGQETVLCWVPVPSLTMDGAGSLWPDFVDFCAVFGFIGEFSPKFDLKNVISTNNKGFFIGPNSPDFDKKKNSLGQISAISSSR